MPRLIIAQRNFLKVISASFARGRALCVLFALCSAMAIGSPAQTFQTLVNFNRSNGASPISAPLQNIDGNLYGTTPQGGLYNSLCSGSCGVAYEMTPGGTLAAFFDFCNRAGCPDGFAPLAGLALTPDGTMYGTTSQGGSSTDQAGTAFKIDIGANYTQLDDFSGPSLPFTTLAQYINGTFYGTTLLGGTYGYGSVYTLSPAGVLTTIYSFNKTNGESPSSMVLGRDGNFYGTTTAGGSGTACNQQGCGTVFRLTPAGKLTVLYNFCTGKCRDGSAPASLIQASDGNLYGVTNGGGRSSVDGTLFKISLSGALKTIYSFCALTNCTDGLAPQTIIEGSDGNLYGTTAGGGDLNCNAQIGGGCGTVFEVTSSGSLATLHTFESTDGAYAYGLTQYTNGSFYGVTSNGGSSSMCNLGCGTIYKINSGLSPFVSFVFPAAKVGETVGILGQGFTGTTSVKLNNTPMNFTVASDTYIQATVPSGASKGSITVTTPGGTLKSNVPFNVIP